MTKWIVLVSLFAPAVAFAQDYDANYFTIQSVEVKKVKSEKLNLKTFNAVIGSGTCAPQSQTFSKNPQLLNLDQTPKPSEILAESILEPVNTFEIILDRVVNVGKKVWNLVSLGKPVVNLSTDIGTAMPYGSRCWLELETWQAPRSETYTVGYKNLYGVEVVKFTYRVIYVYGGSVNGKGAYIGYAAIQPADLKVLWGFTFEAKASVPTTFNMGTKENPVGGMTLEMQYTVKPTLPIQHFQSSHVYHISGKGDFQRLK